MSHARLVAIGSLLLVLLGALLLAVACWASTLRKVSVDDLRADIRRELPAGSSQEAVVSFLQERDVEFSGPYPAKDFSQARAEGIDPNWQVIRGIIRDNSRFPLFGQSSIGMLFVFASSGTLERVIVDESYDTL